MHEVSDWSRVSPLSMIHQGIAFIRQLAGTNPGPLLGLLAGAYAFAQRSPLMLATTAVTLLAAGLALLVLAWLRFQYRVSADTIQVQQGVFTRQNLTLEFDRIQNVRIETPLYLRPFGLARLSIESAGSSSEEVHLPGIPTAHAEILRDRALASHGDMDADEDSGRQAEGESVPQHLLSRRPSDLVIYGISSPAILWGGAILASVLGAVARRVEEAGSDLEPLRALAEQLPDSVSPAWLVVAGIIMLLGVMTLFSVVMALVRYHGYRLEKAGDRYRLHSGLITRREQGLRQYRIQHVRLAQSLVARLFGRHHLTCHQIGMMQPDQPEGGGNRLMAPALTPEEQRQLLAHLLPGLPWQALSFNGVSWRYMLPRLAFWGGLWLAAVLGALYQDASVWILATAPLPPALIWLNWRRQGWCLNGEYLILRGGLFGCHYTVFAGFRAQKVRVYDSPLQRRAGLANLATRLGSGAFLLPFIRRPEAEMLMDELLYRMETSNAPWL
ncbi:putative membrane protein YdbT with pleckstrin-like domain [Halospina denitrificans]|uniref:Putative membrane protein YdbT with pleckstrin-like domain n=1 Tax=Halospina denitrificans TaxID=332522 RepID=A0A4R7JHU9_9GAMM|nr:PH domain-containing protein [Halospina denitrificans]TDT37054.1 putative membrane protein YdbT with pleckstrin-like domain [Halospina denitrificans]